MRFGALTANNPQNSPSAVVIGRRVGRRLLATSESSLAAVALGLGTAWSGIMYAGGYVAALCWICSWTRGFFGVSHDTTRTTAGPGQSPACGCPLRRHRGVDTPVTPHVRRGAPKHSSPAALLILLAAAALGCGSGAKGPTSSNQIQCRGSVDRVDSADGLGVIVLDVVVFPVDPVQTGGRVGPTGTPQAGLEFAKFGLLVREGAELTLETDSSGHPRALMDWALVEPDRPSEVLTVGPCAEAGEGWLVFPGGVWVSEPGCIVIEVSSASQTGEARLGVDQPCG